MLASITSKSPLFTATGVHIYEPVVSPTTQFARLHREEADELYVQPTPRRSIDDSHNWSDCNLSVSNDRITENLRQCRELNLDQRTNEMTSHSFPLSRFRDDECVLEEEEDDTTFAPVHPTEHILTLPKQQVYSATSSSSPLSHSVSSHSVLDLGIDNSICSDDHLISWLLHRQNELNDQLEELNAELLDLLHHEWTITGTVPAGYTHLRTQLGQGNQPLQNTSYQLPGMLLQRANTFNLARKEASNEQCSVSMPPRRSFQWSLDSQKHYSLRETPSNAGFTTWYSDEQQKTPIPMMQTKRTENPMYPSKCGDHPAQLTKDVHTPLSGANNTGSLLRDDPPSDCVSHTENTESPMLDTSDETDFERAEIELKLRRLEVDYAVVSRLHVVHKQRAAETKREAYRIAYKANSRKLKEIATQMQQLRTQLNSKSTVSLQSASGDQHASLSIPRPRRTWRPFREKKSHIWKTNAQSINSCRDKSPPAPWIPMSAPVTPTSRSLNLTKTRQVLLKHPPSFQTTISSCSTSCASIASETIGEDCKTTRKVRLRGRRSLMPSLFHFFQPVRDAQGYNIKKLNNPKRNDMGETPQTTRSLFGSSYSEHPGNFDRSDMCHMKDEMLFTPVHQHYSTKVNKGQLEQKPNATQLIQNQGLHFRDNQKTCSTHNTQSRSTGARSSTSLFDAQTMIDNSHKNELRRSCSLPFLCSSLEGESTDAKRRQSNATMPTDQHKIPSHQLSMGKLSHTLPSSNRLQKNNTLPSSTASYTSSCNWSTSGYSCLSSHVTTSNVRLGDSGCETASKATSSSGALRSYVSLGSSNSGSPKIDDDQSDDLATASLVPNTKAIQLRDVQNRGRRIPCMVNEPFASAMRVKCICSCASDHALPGEELTVTHCRGTSCELRHSNLQQLEPSRNLCQSVPLNTVNETTMSSRGETRYQSCKLTSNRKDSFNSTMRSSLRPIALFRRAVSRVASTKRASLRNIRASSELTNANRSTRGPIIIPPLPVKRETRLHRTLHRDSSRDNGAASPLLLGIPSTALAKPSNGKFAWTRKLRYSTRSIHRPS